MGYGGDTDYFGLATTHAELEMLNSEFTPATKTVVEARDENHDVAAITAKTPDLGTYQVVYRVIDDFNLDELKLGEIVVTDVYYIIESITLDTDNDPGKLPRLTVSAKGIFTSSDGIVAPTTKANTFTLPSVAVKANMFAQAFGFTYSNGKLTSSKVEATCTPGVDTDNDGDAANYGVGGAMCECSGDFIIPSAVAVTVEVTQGSAVGLEGPGVIQPDGDYHTGSGKIWVVKLARDAASP